MLTDGLRALLLEEAGYDTQVFEFVSLEHTSKNKMILATRRARPPSAEARAALRRQIDELKAFYGVRDHCLETLLARDRAAPEGASAAASGSGSATTASAPMNEMSTETAPETATEMAPGTATAPAVASAPAPELVPEAAAPHAGPDSDRRAGPDPGADAGR